MSGSVERRALLALYRNHPATGPGDRYNWAARAEAARTRDMLLGWAATKTDEELLWCRNLGPVALRWIRDQTGDPPSPFADLESEIASLRKIEEAARFMLESAPANPKAFECKVITSRLLALRAALDGDR